MRVSKPFFLTAILLLVLSTIAWTCEQKQKWWHDTVFYQIWPRSFHDSDGDGNGDFKGMTARLDYLKKLGVKAVWLNPMLEAPSYHGYDFVDFFNVESDYGTNADFEEFLAEAEARGIKVIADLVINHISNQNDWFIKSAQRIDPYTDFFVWEKEIPQGPWGKPWARPGDIGYNQPAWVWIWNDVRQEYYYGAFDGSQPDLNLKNPLVVEELKKIAKYWIDKGFDGFRLDAIRFAIEEGPYPLQADTQSSIDFWTDFTTYIKSLSPDIVLVGEAWSDIPTITSYYNDGKGLDLCFDFEFGSTVIDILNGKQPIATAMLNNFNRKTTGTAPVSFFSPFLTNHDQKRLMYELNNDWQKARTAAVLLLTTVGTPFIYYGEEIGMTQSEVGDDLYKRTPMQWDASDYAGFNQAGPLWVDQGIYFPWLPQHGPWWQDYWNSIDQEKNSVQGQLKDKNSLLRLYHKLIKLRKNNPEFRNIKNKSLRFINTNNENVLVFLRKSGFHHSLVMINGSMTAPQEVKVKKLKKYYFFDLIKRKPVTFPKNKITLQPGQFYILKIL